MWKLGKIQNLCCYHLCLPESPSALTSDTIFTPLCVRWDVLPPSPVLFSQFFTSLHVFAWSFRWPICTENEVCGPCIWWASNRFSDCEDHLARRSQVSVTAPFFCSHFSGGALGYPTKFCVKEAVYSLKCSVYSLKLILERKGEGIEKKTSLI